MVLAVDNGCQGILALLITPNSPPVSRRSSHKKQSDEEDIWSQASPTAASTRTSKSRTTVASAPTFRCVERAEKRKETVEARKRKLEESEQSLNQRRLMLLEENQIAFHSEDGLNFDGVKDYPRQITEMIGLGSDSEFLQAGVRTVLDIGYGFGSFGAHLASLNLMAVCIVKYEATGSQVQLALERGLPAMIGNFISRQLPYPSLSFDMVHCAQCSIAWDNKGTARVIAVNTLHVILDQGFLGVLHNWCEAFPTYPRTYGMLHTNGLLSHITSERCNMMDLFLEMDRILRPEENDPYRV